MLSAFARAVESFFGPALQPSASLLRVAATVAMITILAASGWTIARAFAAWRYGWTTVPAVACPLCGGLALDPAQPRCPEGHPVRFPPGARIVSSAGHYGQASRRVLVLFPVLGAGALASVALLAYRVVGIGRLTRPLSTISAGLAYLFLAATLISAGFAFSARSSGAVSRLLHAVVAFVCLFPAGTLGVFARALEPPREREIGSLWTTPSGLYISRAGGRARNCGPAAEHLDALLVEARAPAFGVVWQGLKGFRVGGREVAWKGSGGFAARLLGRWARPLENRGVFLTRSEQPVPLSPNRPVAIVASGERVRFSLQD